MQLQRFTSIFVLLLLLNCAMAARKIKRPVKPAKATAQRNNAAAAAAQSTTNNVTIGGVSSSTTTTAAPFQNKQSDFGGLEVPVQSGANAMETTTIVQDGLDVATEPFAREECDAERTGFEIITGYVLSAPSKVMRTLPGMLMLTDCLDACRINESCSAINYETGLCVLFSSTADILPGSLSRSQLPVFTIYAQKACFSEVRPCSKAWYYDRVQGYRLADHIKSSRNVATRRDCLEACLAATEFTCRSANYYQDTGLCELSDMDRITLTGLSNIEAYDGADYLENHCVDEPNKLCEFKRIDGRILTTVDSIYQDVVTIEDCRELCLNSPYRCHSYDYNETGDKVCRLSHHNRATLTDVVQPYLEVPSSATYELTSCYNVSIDCRSGEMITRIRTSKLFDGKVYAKGSPKSCAINVNNSLEFDLRMGYSDLECNVRQSAYGHFMNDIVIQHHDMIVTSSDLGLAVSCKYDLTNRTVATNTNLDVAGEIETTLSEETFIDSPNVIMRITSRDGNDMRRIAEVGDPLALRFEIVDEQSPYEIFVRELVAMDGTDNAEIVLIDANGCPTDDYIMSAMSKSADSGKILITQFDAFKFPSSDLVQFRALVTPCIPHCEPVVCNYDSEMGDGRSVFSYGRRRRSASNATEEGHAAKREKRSADVGMKEDKLILVESIQITDKFGFKDQQTNTVAPNERDMYTFGEIKQSCVNAYGITIAAGLFLLAQLVAITVWETVQRRAMKLRY